MTVDATGARGVARAWARHAAGCWRPRRDLAALFGTSAPAKRDPANGSSGGNQGGRINVLTGVRALALLWVLAFHAAFLGLASDVTFPPGKRLPTEPPVAAEWISSWLAQPVLNGDLGVDVFFTLSGILIATMWLRETGKRGGRFAYCRFIARRYLRLAPMLAVGICAQLLAGHLGGYLPHKLTSCGRDWWKILLMVNNYTTDHSCLAQSWSVAVEFQFYIFAPLLLYAAWSPAAGRPRRGWRLTLAAAWAAGPLLRVALAVAQSGWNVSEWWRAFNVWGLSNLPLTYTAAFTRASPFVAGMAAALSLEELKRRRGQRQRQQQQEQQEQQQGVRVEDPGLPGAAAARVDAPAELQAVVVVPPGGSQRTPSAGGQGPQAVAPAGPVGESAEAAQPAARAPCGPLASSWCAAQAKGAGAPAPESRGAARAARAARRARGAPCWRALGLACADAAACAAVVAAVLLGGSESRHTASLGLGLDVAVMLAGRAVFGAALAWLAAAAMLGRQKLLAAALGWRGWSLGAGCSYDAYLLQDVPAVVFVSFTSAGAVALVAAWATYWFVFAYFTVLCLAISIPFALFVENPFHRMVPRGY